MNLIERIENYKRAFPNYTHEIGVSWRIYGIWQIGNYYKRKYGFYGEYPPSYLKRVYALFPDKERILHCFSGSLKDERGITFDINPDLNPDVIGDIRNIKEIFEKDQFDLVIADPPYERKDFDIYKQKPFSKGNAVRDIAYIVEPSGFLVWLDIMVPIYSKKLWDLCAQILLLTGTNRRVRIVSIWEKI